ncbi:MAG: hypothetical protein IJO82_01805 [Clostridia bacterium]|nr:hypothetical protein [Clostridia bacterium]MBQ2693304.1 hypothetical protein [Clostridia bacterium]MBQ3051437.1 hypothetical protein [Clostridia bacterium]MBQ5684959.1 hypothetical protein [Clostridia bacterium]MBQ6784522.1 hypothetical protein [Clostridia bacterium]
MASKQHPYVFVHGMMGWGEDKKFYKVIPYWGMVTGNYPRRMREKGYEVYTPTVSPLGSAWDRACELYANLTGTTVDYGVAHSKEKGHNRFGETFPEAMLPDWTPERSIHLLGHSFGGPTMRMFVELLRNGSPEERAATPAGQLSPLFEGGHGDLVKSITTISGPFDGITFPHALPKTVDYGLTYGIPMVASIIGNVGSGRVYDFQMSQWGITAVKNGVRFARDMLNMKAIRNFVKAKDNVFADIHIPQAAEINKKLSVPAEQYLFSVTGNGTKTGKSGNQVRAPIMIFAFAPFAYSLGKFPDQTIAGVKITEGWRMNDGIVPVESGRHPTTEPWCEWVDVKDKPIQKGIWHALPTVPGDHGTVIGGSISFIGKKRGQRFLNAYDFWMDYLDKLPD